MSFAIYPAGIYLLKVNIRNTGTRCEICSKLTIKKPTRWQWRRFGVFIVNFEHISYLCSSVSIANFQHVIAGWYSNSKTMKQMISQKTKNNPLSKRIFSGATVSKIFENFKNTSNSHNNSEIQWFLLLKKSKITPIKLSWCLYCWLTTKLTHYPVDKYLFKQVIKQ